MFFFSRLIFQCLRLARCKPWRFREEKQDCLTHGVCLREQSELVREKRDLFLLSGIY